MYIAKSLIQLKYEKLKAFLCSFTHIDVAHLWIQKTAAERRLRYSKIPGAENPADMLTKELAQKNVTKRS